MAIPREFKLVREDEREVSLKNLGVREPPPMELLLEDLSNLIRCDEPGRSMSGLYDFSLSTKVFSLMLVYVAVEGIYSGLMTMTGMRPLSRKCFVREVLSFKKLVSFVFFKPLVPIMRKLGSKSRNPRAIVNSTAPILISTTNLMCLFFVLRFLILFKSLLQ